MKTIKTVGDLAAVLAVYPQDLALSFTVDRAPAELATDMQISQVHRPDAPGIADILKIALMKTSPDKPLTAKQIDDIRFSIVADNHTERDTKLTRAVEAHHHIKRRP